MHIAYRPYNPAIVHCAHIFHSLCYILTIFQSHCYILTIVRCDWVCHFEPVGDGKGTEPSPPKCNSERLHWQPLWMNNYDCRSVLVSITDLPCSASLVSHPRRCKTSLGGQSVGLSVSRSPVRFRQKLRTSRTQIYRAPVKLLVYFLRSNKSNINQIYFLFSGIQPWSVVSVT